MQLNLTDGRKVEEGASVDDWLPMGEGRRHPTHLPDRREYVVSFEEPGDCWNPKNWTSWKK